MQEAVNLVDRFMGIGWATARKPREVIALLLALPVLALLVVYGHCGWATARKPREVIVLLALLALLVLEKL